MKYHGQWIGIIVGRVCDFLLGIHAEPTKTGPNDSVKNMRLTCPKSRKGAIEWVLRDMYSQPTI